jgi:DNA-binding PadR family transcriptional regulator
LVDGRARKYYRLNEAGSALAQSTQAQLMQELQSLLLIFNPPQMQWT